LPSASAWTAKLTLASLLEVSDTRALLMVLPSASVTLPLMVAPGWANAAADNKIINKIKFTIFISLLYPS